MHFFLRDLQITKKILLTNELRLTGLLDLAVAVLKPHLTMIFSL